MLAPLLSEADPKESQEGTIDPLGTYPIADALAVRLAPGVRERRVRQVSRADPVRRAIRPEPRFS